MSPLSLLYPHGYLRRGMFGYYIQCPNCANTRYLDALKPIWSIDTSSGHLYCPHCSRMFVHLGIELIPVASAVESRTAFGYILGSDIDLTESSLL